MLFLTVVFREKGIWSSGGATAKVYSFYFAAVCKICSVVSRFLAETFSQLLFLKTSLVPRFSFFVWKIVQDDSLLTAHVVKFRRNINGGNLYFFFKILFSSSKFHLAFGNHHFLEQNQTKQQSNWWSFHALKIPFLGGLILLQNNKMMLFHVCSSVLLLLAVLPLHSQSQSYATVSMFFQGGRGPVCIGSLSGSSWSNIAIMCM